MNAKRCDFCGCGIIRHRWRNGVRYCLNGDGCVYEVVLVDHADECDCHLFAGAFCYKCRPEAFRTRPFA